LQILTADYVQSSPNLSGCPATQKPEFAFIGRSNVGKSSLINMICDRSKLALTSSKPGKTRNINHFLINDEWFVVDLPGYGFAQISQLQRSLWLKNTEEYLQKRENLVNTFLLIDASIPPQKKDLEFANWMGEKWLPFSIVFTKTDKAKTTETQKNIAGFKKEMLKSWSELPPVFLCSSEEKKGRDEILAYIRDCIKTYVPREQKK
jgi:GTP-binding protein